MFIIDFLQDLALGFVERLDYSIRIMSLTQWGIVSAIALAVGIGMMKIRRVSL